MAVVLGHSPFFPEGSPFRPISGWGFLGVDLFFVLSGYLIASQWFSELQGSDGRGLFSRFFLRRVFRIWPNYFAILALVIAFKGMQGADLSPIWHYVLFLQNFFPPQGIGITWSLCIEEHFYLAFPLISLFAYRKGPRTALWVILALLLFAVMSRIGLWFLIRPDRLAVLSDAAGAEAYYRYFYHPTFTRLDGLVFGVSVAAIRRFRPAIWVRLVSYRNWWISASMATLFLTALIGLRSIGRYMPSVLLEAGAPSGYSLPSLALGSLGYDLGFAFLVIGALSPGSLLQRVRIPGVPRLALLSYAMYLSHSEVMEWLEKILPVYGIPQKGLIPGMIMLVAVALAAAALYYVVEKPFLLLRDRLLPLTSAASKIRITA